MRSLGVISMDEIHRAVEETEPNTEEPEDGPSSADEQGNEKKESDRITSDE